MPSARVIDRHITTVAPFLDAYFERCVKPAGLRSIASVNVTDEELRKGLEVSWKNQGRPLRLATGH